MVARLALFAFVVSFTAVGSVFAQAAAPGGGGGGGGGADDSGPIRKITENTAKRTANQVGRIDHPVVRNLVLPPLPGEQGFSDSSKDEATFGTLTSYGANITDNSQVLFPPLKGFRQLSDSQAMLDMYKDLITKKVPVMAQTFMMVENGAGSGFFHAMNTVSNTTSNILQANDFQLKAMDITDPSGQMKDAWISSVYKQIDENRESWPAALLGVVGDAASGDDNGGGGPKEFAKVEPTPFNFEKLLDKGASSGSDQGRSILLSALLFDAQRKITTNGGQGAGGDEQYRNAEIEQVKTEFNRYVGDVKIEFDETKERNNQKPRRLVKITRLPPPKGQTDERRGVARAQFEETEVAWKALNKVLLGLCKHEMGRDNEGKEPGQQETRMTTKNIKMEDWEKASAPDFPLSMDIVGAAFDLFAQGRMLPLQECSKAFENREMPTKLQDIDASKLDDCSTPEKGCLRDRVYLHMAYIIGRARALHIYQTLATVTTRFATTASQRMLLSKVFEQTFDGLDIQAELEANRARWNGVMNLIGAAKNNNTGSGSSAFQQNSMPSSSKSGNGDVQGGNP